MGFKDAAWAYTLTLPMAQKVVLVAICHRTDDSSHSTIAGQQTIATMLGCSVEKVRRAIGILESSGILNREQRHGAGGYRTSDQTIVNTTYRAESLPGETPAGRNTRRENNVHLPDESSSPTPQILGAVDVIQIDQSEGHSDVNAIELIPTRSFAEFWIIWPRKDSKKSAAAAWARAITRCDSETIHEAARQYRFNPHIPAKQFIPHAATWLNGDRWQDPLAEARHQQPNGTGKQEKAFYDVLDMGRELQNEFEQKAISA